MRKEEERPEPLTRDEFRKLVFERDGTKCVFCDLPAVDAHHVMERRLFDDGGYYLDNGASVCLPHHLLCEETMISTEEVREKCGIKKVILPSHLYGDEIYDKWANPILPNGTRMKGELFGDPSVQKVLAKVIHLFTDRVKHPRTYHLPWSPGVGKDDRVMTDTSGFQNEEVVLTIKMDGEQTSMYRDGLHARSLEWHPHPSRTWVKALHARIAHDIPEGWRVCGENLWAKHSIHYKRLKDYFLVHSIWDNRNVCLSWEETVEYAKILGLATVPCYAKGPWDERYRTFNIALHECDPCEGYVIRVERPIAYREYRRVVGKYVRAGHVQTHGHWMREAVVKNELEKGNQ